ncbi:histone H3.v1-like isoform X2 [Tripterygium wilfordii]|uniref:histone H3.v1-like isoform X2 n=1 Tax=Tripterygium wilfordii TaxID=458696 RepID=UPI0018F855C7|nr:histone H3.v1-like isoform X2 [Tripterygium wilfordii]
MLKQSPRRIPRSKGLKVKHVLQICVLLATGFWVLHQFKHLYDKKISEELQNGLETMKLGRKVLHPQIKESSSLIGGRGNVVEENKPEEIMDEEAQAGDDEIDGHDHERADEEESEEVEDLIDVDDTERDEGSEEQENEEKDDETEHANLLDDGAENEGEKNAQKAREEQNAQTISTIFQLGGLRMLKEEKVDAENTVSKHRKETNDANDVIVDINNLDPEVGMNVVTEFFSSRHDVSNVENGNKIRLENSATAPNSSSSIEDTNVELSSSSMQVKSLEASNGMRASTKLFKMSNQVQI